MSRWAGVDVGGRRKGFHAAVVDEQRVIAGPLRLPSPAETAAWLVEHTPRLAAVDSPQDAARPGERSREDERLLARAVCGIRFTPEEAALATSPYYEWIVHGRELYEALTAAGIAAIECFSHGLLDTLGRSSGGETASELVGCGSGGCGALGRPPAPQPGRSRRARRRAHGAGSRARCDAVVRGDCRTRLGSCKLRPSTGHGGQA